MKRSSKDNWSLYIAECVDGSYYTGIAKDVQKRIEHHNSGKGAKYTAAHGPVTLVFQEPVGDYSTALRREYQVKGLSKERKIRFVAGEKLAKPKKKAKMTFQKTKAKKKRREPKCVPEKAKNLAGSLRRPSHEPSYP